MNTQQKTLLSFVILIVVIFGLYFFTDWFSKVTGYLGGSDERSRLAKCLDEKGAQFYGGVYCADCEKQMGLFGSAVKFLNYVECETNQKGEVTDEECMNLREIPAWYINKTIVYGYKNFTELEEISGCAIN